MKSSKFESWLDRFNLFIYEEIDSTNDEARKMVEYGVDGEFVIWAKSQYKGRGRNNRSWHSPEGNLYTSLLVRPKTDVKFIPQLSFVASLALGEVLKKFVDPKLVKYKWPNDIIINDKKVAGILLESVIRGNSKLKCIVVGFGVNVASFPEKTNLHISATCVNNEAGKKVDVRDILGPLIEQFIIYYDKWQEDGFAEIRKLWLKSAYKVGETITTTNKKERITGIFSSLDDFGNLDLETEDGNIVKIGSGEIVYSQT